MTLAPGNPCSRRRCRRNPRTVASQSPARNHHAAADGRALVGELHERQHEPAQRRSSGRSPASTGLRHFFPLDVSHTRSARTAVLLMPNAVCQDVWSKANVFDGRQTIRGIEALIYCAQLTTGWALFAGLQGYSVTLYPPRKKNTVTRKTTQNSIPAALVSYSAGLEIYKVCLGKSALQ